VTIDITVVKGAATAEQQAAIAEAIAKVLSKVEPKTQSEWSVPQLRTSLPASWRGAT
jgi:phenylpyruvate tautomerase PptA (4-oxalocrotonate tautomerase family)